MNEILERPDRPAAGGVEPGLLAGGCRDIAEDADVRPRELATLERRRQRRQTRQLGGDLGDALQLTRREPEALAGVVIQAHEPEALVRTYAQEHRADGAEDPPRERLAPRENPQASVDELRTEAAIQMAQLVMPRKFEKIRERGACFGTALIAYRRRQHGRRINETLRDVKSIVTNMEQTTYTSHYRKACTSILRTAQVNGANGVHRDSARAKALADVAVHPHEPEALGRSPNFVPRAALAMGVERGSKSHVAPSFTRARSR
jgi:hypothetical protein